MIDKNFYPTDEAKSSNNKWRPVGLGVMGTQEFFRKLNINFDDEAAIEAVENIHAFIYYHALMASIEMAKVDGPFENYEKSKFAQGLLHIDLYDNDRPLATPNGIDWNVARKALAKYGARNSLMIAIAPTATIASIVGVGECTEPNTSNLFTRTTLSGEFVQVNASMVADLKQMNLWDESMQREIQDNDGSLQNIPNLPEWIKRRHRTVWEYSMHTIMRLAQVRARYIDQGQSLNLFMENATIGKVSSMYMAAWKKYKLKTTYYLRTRAATRIAKVGGPVSQAQPVPEVKKEYTEEEVIMCSLDNPEACEACQ